MFNVCPGCGMWAVDKVIDPGGPYAICPHCGYKHRFVHLPLFVITGASGSGKTAACQNLAPRMRACVCLENDILWRTEFATLNDNYRSYRELSLRLAKNINQAGRPVALFGTALPDQIESCLERRYFTSAHYLALVCDDAQIIQRLQNRPAWRQAGSPEFIEGMRRFNQWLKENAGKTDPPMTLLDNSHLTVTESADLIAAWIQSRLAGQIDTGVEDD